MVKKIAIFNYEFGFSQEITTFYLGWILATKGYKVILVDANPTCSLTASALGDKTQQERDRIEKIYNKKSDIKIGLAPAFESQPRVIKAIDCIPIGEPKGLFLLPGHRGLFEYEATLNIAQDLRNPVQSLKDLPGSITDLLNKTASKFNADYILINMGDTLGAINQNLLMTSDFFIIPAQPDLFSAMSIDSLSRVLPKWYHWAKQASSLPIFKTATYPFPNIELKFLGIVIYDDAALIGKKADFSDKHFRKIEEDVSNQLIPNLVKNNMMLPLNDYTKLGISESYFLQKITNFEMLSICFREYQKPLYDLSDKDLDIEKLQVDLIKNSREENKKTFSDLADKVINLTSAYAVSN
ncbi:ParA family protein [Crocosphaera chwakensis]|uniref:Regulatory protein cII n=1 Tax=Crocosphaera chwakensis CCY0110 TaxID=391612 RepID=A3ILH7_9CHRO|nr:AAA family ATPase [Crocosphaera chwakensis]EAZ92628.1 regulatory protein cII [Crocosphaera chwakensis CCY0110]